MKLSLKKIVSNIYVRNILLMIIILIALIGIALLCLNSYTRHGESIVVPSLKKLQVEEAEAILRSRGLNYEVVDSVYEKKGAPGSILEQIPRENTRVKSDRTIYLIVQARSLQYVPVADMTDYSQRQATALLNALGFNDITIDEVPSDYQGLVLSVEYKGKPISAGEKIPKGAALRMKVGSGRGSSFESDSIEETNEIEENFN